VSLVLAPSACNVFLVITLTLSVGSASHARLSIHCVRNAASMIIALSVTLTSLSLVLMVAASATQKAIGTSMPKQTDANAKATLKQRPTTASDVTRSSKAANPVLCQTHSWKVTTK